VSVGRGDPAYQFDQPHQRQQDYEEIADELPAVGRWTPKAE